jgi:hypothetical protein
MTRDTAVPSVYVHFQQYGNEKVYTLRRTDELSACQLLT